MAALDTANTIERELLREAVRVAGNQSQLAKRAGVAQASISLGLSSGYLTPKMLRALAGGIMRLKLGKPIAERMLRRANAIETAKRAA